jgi:hypothetical protein
MESLSLTLALPTSISTTSKNEDSTSMVDESICVKANGEDNYFEKRTSVLAIYHELKASKLTYQNVKGKTLRCTEKTILRPNICYTAHFQIQGFGFGFGFSFGFSFVLVLVLVLVLMF